MAMTKCKVEGCLTVALHKGFCRAHYRRQAKGLPLDTPLRKQKNQTTSTIDSPHTCRISNCGRPVHIADLCAGHYRRHRLGLPTETLLLSDRPRSSLKCVVEGCLKPVLAKGACNAHYIRNHTGKPLEGPIKVYDGTQGCRVEGCKKKHHGLGYCVGHEASFRRMELIKILINRHGGKCMDCQGVFHPLVYDFHHRDPKNKDYMISQKINSYPLEKLLVETDKCDLLCSNCHRMRHNNGIF